MNCDQAFEAMTDPRGAEAGRLHRHLQSCPRCRRMRETLEPALGALTPLVAGRSTPRHPGENDPASLAAVRMARRVADRLSVAHTRTKPAEQREVSRAWGYLLSASCGALVAIGALLAIQQPASSPLLAEGCVWQHRQEAFAAHTPRALVLSCVNCHL